MLRSLPASRPPAYVTPGALPFPGTDLPVSSAASPPVCVSQGHSRQATLPSLLASHRLCSWGVGAAETPGRQEHGGNAQGGAHRSGEGGRRGLQNQPRSGVRLLHA